MSSSTPAWKRLGLTLKPSSSESHGDSNAPSPSALGGAKRKPSAALASDHSNKKLRTDHSSPAHIPAKRPKTVSFAAEPQTVSNTPTTTHTKQKKANPPKPLKPQAQKQSNVNLQPSVDYLRQWHKARDQWKFNKNHQTKLLENVFSDGATIPAVDINIFYEYIRGLKGYVRTRLRESAMELKKTDMEQGAEAFANSSKEAAQRKQREYDEVIAGFMREGQTPEKRRFEEVDYVLRTADMEMQRRVVKRMRAEMIVEELSDGEESTATTTNTTTTTSTVTGGARAGVAEDTDADKRLKLNDGSQQKIKRKRKTRTAEVESSSSESESDSDSDSDEDSSSSDGSSSDEEDGTTTNADREEAETSSSSSSSSSEDDSDTEGEDSDGDNDGNGK